MENKFQFAKELIKEAGKIIKREMFHNLKIEVKTCFDDLVTNLDKETQNFLISSIKKHYQDDCVFAEEDDVRHPIDKGNVWVIDPIDGTVNFIVQQRNFAIMIAYFEHGVGQFGLIYDVMSNELYSGGGQFEVCLNENPLPFFKEKSLERCLISSNSEMYVDESFGIRDFAQQTLGVRMYGSAGISMANVLAGRLLAYFSYIQPWDYSAAMIMGEKLGYTLLTMEGQRPNFKTREKVMFVPKITLPQIKSYLSYQG